LPFGLAIPAGISRCAARIFARLDELPRRIGTHRAARVSGRYAFFSRSARICGKIGP
jgi:hypothetical protein